jgi:hypothetical protein
MATEVGATVQVAGVLAPVGVAVALQARATVPVSPLEGVTVMVEVLPVVAPREPMLMLPLLVNVKPGEVTVAVTTLVGAIEPEVPVTVTV